MAGSKRQVMYFYLDHDSQKFSFTTFAFAITVVCCQAKGFSRSPRMTGGKKLKIFDCGTNL